MGYTREGVEGKPKIPGSRPTYASLAEEYGVTTSTVMRIIRNQVWEVMS